MPDKPMNGPFRVIAVVVLYKCRPNDSKTLRTLAAARSALTRGQDEIRVLIHDNSPKPLERIDIPADVMYEAPGHNVGLPAAYNRGLALAASQRLSWLLTLDQDTSLPPDFLYRIRELAVKFETDSRIAAIVPCLHDSGLAISPVLIGALRDKAIQSGFEGSPNGEVRALNSASLFKVSDLQEIGGFDPRFWLDFADTSIYRRLHLRGKKTYVAGNLHVPHELSIHRRESLSVERFCNILDAEGAFSDLYDGRFRRALLSVRLLGRLYKQFRRGDRTEIRQVTWTNFKRRILRSRGRRIRDWQNGVERRLSRMSFAPGMGIPISVCMATYNGERFLREQLSSILTQLGREDEVIVVDDASSDGTLGVIDNFRDDRIRVLRQSKNSGVLKTFARALSEARGDLIFLSDQDDIWHPHKVETIRRLFLADPDISLIASDFSIIDAEGRTLVEMGSSVRRFHAGVVRNIIRNRYLGCSMAFRRWILDYCLPFPDDTPMHDMWIGIVNQIIGKAGYIDEPLVAYRRHGRNASPEKHASFSQMVRWRWALVKNVLAFYLRRRDVVRDGC